MSMNIFSTSQKHEIILYYNIILHVIMCLTLPPMLCNVMMHAATIFPGGPNARLPSCSYARIPKQRKGIFTTCPVNVDDTVCQVVEEKSCGELHTALRRPIGL